VIYHLAPMMGAEGHRRLIGNDICITFFLEEGTPLFPRSPPCRPYLSSPPSPLFFISLFLGHNVVFDPTQIAELGQVPQVFAVVQPVGEKFRYEYISESLFSENRIYGFV